mgnify:CR=1 FL=1
MDFLDKKQITRKLEPMGHECDSLGLCNKEKGSSANAQGGWAYMVAKEDNMDQVDKNAPIKALSSSKT